MQQSNYEAGHVMRINEVFKALADPTRREILRLLRQGEKTAGELAAHFEDRMSKPSVSHHFSVLKAVDFILEAMSGSDLLRRCELLIAGDGPERPRLEADVRRLGLEGSVRFLGFVDNAVFGIDDRQIARRGSKRRAALRL